MGSNSRRRGDSTHVIENVLLHGWHGERVRDNMWGAAALVWAPANSSTRSLTAWGSKWATNKGLSPSNLRVIYSSSFGKTTLHSPRLATTLGSVRRGCFVLLGQLRRFGTGCNLNLLLHQRRLLSDVVCRTVRRWPTYIGFITVNLYNFVKFRDTRHPFCDIFCLRVCLLHTKGCNSYNKINTSDYKKSWIDWAN